ncbi:hypothetical protein ACXYTJ_14165 [Gilvimarinus sp. F26214L]|uniref:hypothetical protein n=1 Tax=Gilvimarinus sp. DZF01 TaxID=3461371 RepID=UPI0040457CD9
MKRFLSSMLLITACAAFQASPAYANGEIGEHVNDLEAHIDDYTGEVRWFLDEADTIVDRYESKPESADPAKLIENWEAVDFHAAIETSFVPVYASIWQGIFGVHDGIKQGKPVAEVREQQQALEEAMWQALGAVKLAAKYQAEQPVASDTSLAADPVATLSEVREQLDRVVAKYAERDLEAATSIVHDTYATRFEGVEGALIEQDAALVEDLEKDFNVTLPLRIEGGKVPVAEVKSVVEAMQVKLERAQALLREAEQNRRSVF